MSADEFVYRRVFRAPRDLVWRCLTDPRHLAEFWGPTGMTTPVDGIVVELWPGGRFETLMVGTQGSYRMVATFTDIDPPACLGWIDPVSGVQTTTTLDDLGERGTSVLIHQRNEPAAMRTPQARAGFLSSFDKFDVYLAHLTEGHSS